jgi:hypothetical protein
LFAVFSPNSLFEFIAVARSDGCEPPKAEGPIDDDLSVIRHEKNLFFAHRIDDIALPNIFVDLLTWQEFSSPAEQKKFGHKERMARFFERIDRTARSFRQNDVAIPQNWNKYSHKNFVTFFAAPRMYSWGKSHRWIAEKLPDGGACFWRTTTSDEELRLEDFNAEPSLLDEIRRRWQESLPSTLSLLPPRAPSSDQLQLGVDLDLTGARPVTQARSYSSWLRLLTDEQRRVVEYQNGGALKIRGRAGSGKTLTLELRALAELYRAADEDRTAKLLFLTHSWAMQEQVESSLNELDERGIWQASIDVMPLPFLQELIQGRLPSVALLLGDDSLAGKKRQLDLIADSIDSVIESTASTYRGKVGELVGLAIDDLPHGAARLTLAWQLMREFAEVIDAHRLKPGIDSLNRYVSLPRESWMILLDKKADREFAFTVYRLYVHRLVEEGQMTTDQAVDDFRAYLEGYTWNIRRSTEGYDLIIVDEYHLFNDTERYLLHLLTSDPDRYPSLVLATDPAQSPFALLTGLHSGELARLASGRTGMDSTNSVELSIMHRFTRNIHSFVGHIYGRLPNLVELGSDWIYNFESISSQDLDGEKPGVGFYKPDEVIEHAIKLATELNKQMGQDERVAILGVTINDFIELNRNIESSSYSKNFVAMNSREDVSQIGYARRAIVLTSAEYAAGLQFNTVVIVSLVNPEEGYRSASATRAAVSQLYLAATRSVKQLFCVSTSADTEVSNVLRSAVESGVAISL